MKDLTRVLDVYMHATTGSKSWLFWFGGKARTSFLYVSGVPPSSSSWRTRFLPAKRKQNLIVANLRTKKEELPGLDLGTKRPPEITGGKGEKTALTDMD